MERVRIQAPAKINIHLEVGGLRGDGFHELVSIFQGINFYDDIEVALQGASGECLIEGNFPCSLKDNLIYKGVQLFRSLTGDDRGLSFQVKKRIPHQAGLGGGSSDAAAALKALTLLLGKDPGDAALYEMAAKLGSDVPFFMGKEGCALVKGRGEKLESLPVCPHFGSLYGLLVMDGGPGISTKEAFAAIDRFRIRRGSSGFTLCGKNICRAWMEDEPSRWPFFNSFMESCRNTHKGLETIYNFLYALGADFVGLSGSGSTLFGLFGSEKNASRARENLRAKGFPFVQGFQFIREVPFASFV